MAQETNQSQAPLLCSTDCGFYSSPRNNGMCSVCYKYFLQRQNSSVCISPPGPSSVDSSVGGSALTQSSVSIAITSLAARSCSGPTTASVTSTEGSTSGAKSSLTADYVQTSGSEESVNAALETEEKPKAKKSRCFTCRKKLGLTGFQCRCGNAFCSMHRYSDTHNCTFDYRANAAEKLREENPIVVAEKIQKI
ncbi:AN1-type zinc finger protein 6 isoform X3 [Scophthalmus maximus]|uniref:AN1-type zinc finger protein 6 isoform X3 n=1 Tax=Scophthalmus maximus TaxID=52904 RepID=UPI0015E09A08|nr:AN1-type zinc finger protein 6 isoform X3 [Scophthalmus maximus]